MCFILCLCLYTMLPYSTLPLIPYTILSYCNHGAKLIIFFANLKGFYHYFLKIFKKVTICRITTREDYQSATPAFTNINKL